MDFAFLSDYYNEFYLLESPYTAESLEILSRKILSKNVSKGFLDSFHENETVFEIFNYFFEKKNNSESLMFNISESFFIKIITILNSKEIEFLYKNFNLLYENNNLLYENQFLEAYCIHLAENEFIDLNLIKFLYDNSLINQAILLLPSKKYRKILVENEFIKCILSNEKFNYNFLIISFGIYISILESHVKYLKNYHNKIFIEFFKTRKFDVQNFDFRMAKCYLCAHYENVDLIEYFYKNHPEILKSFILELYPVMDYSIEKIYKIIVDKINNDKINDDKMNNDKINNEKIIVYKINNDNTITYHFHSSALNIENLFYKTLNNCSLEVLRFVKEIHPSLFYSKMSANIHKINF